MASTANTSPALSPSALRAALERDGFVIQRAVLSPEDLTALRSAAARLTALARAGRWPHVRTVGKQFPPWPAPAAGAGDAPPPDIWGVQHLLHPDLPLAADERAAFVRLYFCDAVLGPARALMTADGDGGGTEEEAAAGADDGDGLVLELLNLLVSPARTPFQLRWHRDDIPASATAAEEEARLLRPAGPALHAQYNLALHADASLLVVPGSHRRARTATERAAAPHEDPLPGQAVVALGPGDVVFYDNNVLHRGVYEAEASVPRLTLHGSVGHGRGSAVRARNVLQHGVGEWVDRCDFACLGTGPERRRAEAMRERLVRLGRESGDVGYSLEG